MKTVPQGHSLHRAFTMMELVFVIIIMGILTAVILPNTRSNPVHEAAIQLANHIKYTQHLAMTDDKYDVTDVNWEKARWQMVFTFNAAAANNQLAYTIFSDDNGYGGDASFGEMAKNPVNINQVMTGGHTGNPNLSINNNSFVGMKKLNLGNTYGLTGMTRTGGCVNLVHLTFDSLGRPISGTHTAVTNTHQLITNDCNLTLTDGSETVTIIVEPETGFTCVIDSTGACI